MIAQFAGRNISCGFAVAVFAALLVPTLIATIFDSRTLDGVNVWIKPAKFELSLLVYFATLLWCCQWIPDSIIEHRLFRYYSAALVVFALIEMIWILAAAASGNASHFNTEHPIFAPVYPVMGLVAIALLSATLVYGVLIITTPADTGSDLFWRHAIGSALVATFVLTAVTAGYLASASGHGVGVVADSGTGLFGWLRGAGDLRVAHFFAMHTMQMVPLVLWLIVLLPSVNQSLLLVYTTLAIYGGFVVFTFYQALAGKAFLPTVL